MPSLKVKFFAEIQAKKYEKIVINAPRKMRNSFTNPMDDSIQVLTFMLAIYYGPFRLMGMWILKAKPEQIRYFNNVHK